MGANVALTIIYDDTFVSKVNLVCNMCNILFATHHISVSEKKTLFLLFLIFLSYPLQLSAYDLLKREPVRSFSGKCSYMFL